MEPFFADAVQVTKQCISSNKIEIFGKVLEAESGNLDPLQVLNALSEHMPIHLAYPTLAKMLRERMHRRRQTKIACNLHRLRTVLSRAEK